MKNATEIARRMVCLFGMSEDVAFVSVYAQNEGSYKYSEKTAEKIDAAVQQILESCLRDTITLLKENSDKLELLAQTLVEKETMDAKQVYTLLGLQEPGTIEQMPGTGEFAT